jgi:hypothetical protein
VIIIQDFHNIEFSAHHATRSVDCPLGHKTDRFYKYHLAVQVLQRDLATRALDETTHGRHVPTVHGQAAKLTTAVALYWINSEFYSLQQLAKVHGLFWRSIAMIGERVTIAPLFQVRGALLYE